MTFLEKLDFLMKRDGLNRRNLSRGSGIPYTTIDNWYKRGYEGLQLSTAGKLADYFHTTTDFFLRDDLTDPNYAKQRDLLFPLRNGIFEKIQNPGPLRQTGRGWGFENGT